MKRAERRAASKPAPALRPSMPALAGMEPRPSFAMGNRPMYPSGKGPS